MRIVFSRHRIRKIRKRLRPDGGAPGRGFRAAVNKPFALSALWGLVWLSAFLLAMLDNRPGSDFPNAGQRAPATIAAAVDFQRRGGGEGPGEAAALIPAGTILVERGQTITARQAAILRDYEAQRRAGRPFAEPIRKLAGDGLLLAVCLMVGFLLLRLAPRPDSLEPASRILLFLVAGFFSLAFAKVCLRVDPSPWLAPWLGAFLPLALAPILLTILVGPAEGLAVGIWVAGAAAVLADGRMDALLSGLAVTAVAVRSARSARGQWALYRVGLAAGLAGAAVAAGCAALRLPGSGAVPILSSLAAGLVAAPATILLLPLLEALFGLTSDLSLLGLTDLEHPLLKRLALEAPGTYHHSLMVANLAQAAVKAVGGNALRAGIAAYFHDIGKLVKPAFFSENNQYGDNPHDDLSPSMSALILVSHVKEGVNLALRHKLPRLVIEAIEQHHGTSLIRFFYHKAAAMQREAALPDGAEAIQAEAFMYPGPKPRTREIAVLSLADAVEAASRSLEKITPGSLEDLVQEIVESRLSDGQLDACDLTLSEISTVRRVLVLTLSNMLHGRIAYPGDEPARPELPAPGPAEP